MFCFLCDIAMKTFLKKIKKVSMKDHTNSIIRCGNRKGLVSIISNYYSKILMFKSISILFYICLACTSCKKLVEIPPPPDQLAGNNVFTNDESAISVLTGIYVSMSQTGTFSGIRSIGLYTGLSSDELTLYNGVVLPEFTSYYNNKLRTENNVTYGAENWSSLYSFIYKC